MCTVTLIEFMSALIANNKRRKMRKLRRKMRERSGRGVVQSIRVASDWWRGDNDVGFHHVRLRIRSGMSWR